MVWELPDEIERAQRIMTNSPLSRWTMAFFAMALIFLISAEGLMVSGYGFPNDAIEAPGTLVIVHLVAVGWLSLLMCGALFQFVPVLVAQPLRRAPLALPAFACLTAGLCFLLAGFLQLSGAFEIGIPFLVLGGTFLPLGFALAAWVLGDTLWHARPLTLPARFVAVGLTCLVVVAVLGSLFTFLLSGFIPANWMAEHHGHLVPLHAALGIGGWLSFSAAGVSYRLLPMFMLAPDRERITSRWAWLSGCTALFALILLAPLELTFRQTITLSLAMAGLLGLFALLLYCTDLIFLYRNRKRRQVELNIRAAGGAFLALFASVLLGVALVASGTLLQHVGALFYLVSFGWLTGLGLSQLYKIVPFLTWLECYGPVMGRKPTPRVQDLVVERRDRVWFALYFAGVSAATGALLAGHPTLFGLGAAITLLATIAIAIELVIARRLANVSAALRLPEGARLPCLFMALPGGR